MIDSKYRGPYQKFIINPLLKSKYINKALPNAITFCALLLGVLCFIFLYFEQRFFALVALILSGFFDTLDGSLARSLKKTTPFGAAFDIFSDRVVETFVIIGLFFISKANPIPILLMLASSYLCVTSFLVVGIFTQNSSEKSFHYSPGLIERAEAFIFFGFMICIPYLLSPLAYLYSFFVTMTAIIRLIEFKKISAYLPKEN